MKRAGRVPFVYHADKHNSLPSGRKKKKKTTHNSSSENGLTISTNDTIKQYYM